MSDRRTSYQRPPPPSPHNRPYPPPPAAMPPAHYPPHSGDRYNDDRNDRPRSSRKRSRSRSRDRYDDSRSYDRYTDSHRRDSYEERERYRDDGPREREYSQRRSRSPPQPSYYARDHGRDRYDRYDDRPPLRFDLPPPRDRYREDLPPPPPPSHAYRDERDFRPRYLPTAAANRPRESEPLRIGFTQSTQFPPIRLGFDKIRADEQKTSDGNSRPSLETSEASPSSPPRYCYVHLVMKGDSYIPGALVSAYSIRLTNTPHALVCMVTPDVTATGRQRLLLVFDSVVEVPYISAHCTKLKTAKQSKMYESWVDVAFTKWNILSLTDYTKVLFIDADKIVLANIDHLFALSTPAATFSSPWSVPYVHRTKSKKCHRGNGLNNPYQYLGHGDSVNGAMIEAGLHTNSFVIIGTMVLVTPSLADFHRYQSMLAQHTVDRPFGYERCHSMMDEQSLTVFYNTVKRAPFTYIHQRYNFISWHREWLDDNDRPFVYHYFSTKPWVLKRADFVDLECWWTLATAIINDTQRYADDDKRALVRECFNNEQLESEGLKGCAWCQACDYAESVWQSHAVFSKDGSLQCPELVPLGQTGEQSHPDRGRAHR